MAKSASLEGQRILVVKFDATCEAAHYLFLQPHNVRDPCPEKPNLRTLLVSNVPQWAAVEGEIRRIFQSSGAIERVFLQSEPSPGPPHQKGQNGAGFKYAYVVFERPSSLRKALSQAGSPSSGTITPKILSKTAPVGLERWRAQYNESVTLDLEALSKELQRGVAELDRKREEDREKALRQKDEEQLGEEDDEGWVTVSRHTTRKPVGGASQKAQAKIKAKEARKRKRKELENFYKHQMKEKKIQRLNDLKEKFEKDKQRQLQMKIERKFKPA